MENQILNKLAEQLNLTSHNDEPEEYILSRGEEDNLISHEILSLKRYATWKMKGLGYNETQIIDKINEINWSEEIDRDEILKRGNSNKLYSIWQEQQRIKERVDEKNKIEELAQLYTAKTIFSLMQWTSENIYNQKLLVTQCNKHLITSLCFFLSNDKRFQTELGYSFGKGLLIRGTSGLGKTYLPKCVEKNQLNPISIYSMIEIADEIKLDGEFSIPHTSGIIYIDDVGSEESIINHYGTKINFFKNYIESIYLKTHIFNRLMISTNINFSEIEQRYGFRVRSRIKDMFNIIDVSGTDMRGNG